MSLLDRIQPSRRASRDKCPPHTRSFDAATGSRRASVFRAFGATATETLAAAGPVRSRARHAAANNGYIANGIAALVGEAVGAGIEAASACPDTALRPILDATYNTFAASADAEGRTDLRGLMAQMARACVVDGEAFALIEEDGLRLIPAEMVDESRTMDLASGGYVVAGIEFDAFGRRVGYHVLPARPTDLYATARDPVRIPADDVLHLMRPLGPGQVRGVSWLAPILLTLAELDSLLDALLVGAKVAACHAGFISNLNEIGGSAFEDTGADGDVSLEPGIVRRLSPGETITFNSPTEAKESIAFAKLTLGQIAAGLGVPQHLLDGDLTGANYSSLRAGLLPFRQKVEQFQYHCLIPQVFDPLWRRAVTRAYLAGQIELPNLDATLAVEWLPPRPMQVDPLKDTQALVEMIDRGLTSRRQAVASLGWNVATLDADIAADRAREASLGLTFSGGSPDA